MRCIQGHKGFVHSRQPTRSNHPTHPATAKPFWDYRAAGRRGKIVARNTATRHVDSPSEILDLRKIGADGIGVTVGLAKDADAADGFTLFTEQHDFEYALQIHGSDDNKTWRLLADNAVIYDYSRYMAIDKRDITLPPNRYRYFQIIIAKAGQTDDH